MSSLKPPSAFEAVGNVAEAWARWEQRFELYYVAAELDKKTVAQQRATLLHIVGDSALEVYNTLLFEEIGEAQTTGVILNKFRVHYQPYKNTTYQRYLFFNTSQSAGQSIEAFVTELRTRSRECEFEQLAESLVRDRLICGILDGALREALLREHDLTLSRAIDLCRAAENSKEQVKAIVNNGEASLNALSHTAQKAYSKDFKMNYNKQHDFREHLSGDFGKRLNSYATGNMKNCSKCGTSHNYRNCPAYGKDCRNCKGRNHFARMCRIKKVQTLMEDEDSLFIGSLQLDQIKGSETEWVEDVSINGQIIKMKLDTGSEVNVLPQQCLISCSKNYTIRPVNTILTTYTGEKVPVRGKCILTCEARGSKYDLSFYVVPFNSVPILGLQACETLGFLKRAKVAEIKNVQYPTEILNEFKDIFTGLGELPGFHHISIKEGAVPVADPPRKLPHALQEAVKLELENMERLGVISKVTEPSEWASPLVVVPKENGKVRICLDPRNLNAAIVKEQHHIPIIDDMLSKMRGCTVFTVLDASKAFWQVCLDEESSRLCTVATPFGRYRFLRLPYGIKSAPEVYQNLMDSLYADMEKVCTYFDDILVGGTDQQDHDSRLWEVLNIARNVNLHLSKEKLQMSQSEVQYVGHTISSKGIAPNPKKCKAIENLKPPENRKDLQRILEMFTYLGKFVPNLPCSTAYLRNLLSRTTVWCWDESAEKSFQDLKKLVSTAPVLVFFDPKKPVVLSVDASQNGLGAVLLQDQKPVMYASAALNTTQQRYAQIEEELLAVLYGCQRFHYYVYGYEVPIETDHQPLLSIAKKSLEDVSPRLQRMLLKLQRYNVHLKYVPGKNLHVADALSRDPDQSQDVDTNFIDDQVPYLKVNLIVSMSEGKKHFLVQETTQDPVLQQVIQYIHVGWPQHIKSCNHLAKPFWNFHNELHVQKGLLCRGQKIVVPLACRKEMLQLLHSSHQGIGATKRRAKEGLYWPGMDKEIENVVINCQICQKFQRQNMKEPLQQHPVPNRVWEKLGIDFFHLNGNTYLLLTDYFSKYPELQLVPKTDAASVITVLKSMFARHGIPD